MVYVPNEVLTPIEDGGEIILCRLVLDFKLPKWAGCSPLICIPPSS